MKLLIDNMLPSQLGVFLRRHGHDVTHVADIGLDEADDIDLWQHAMSEQAVLISKDADFVFLANRPGDTGRLIWVRLTNCRNVALLAALEQVHDQIFTALDAGQRIVEVR